MIKKDIKNKILIGNVFEKIKEIPDKSINCCVTSPPYWGLRDYGTAAWIGGDPDCNHRKDTKQTENNITGHKSIDSPVGDDIYKDVCKKCGAIREDNQIGLEETPELFVEKMVQVFREVKRVLRDDGVLWLNLGDSYNNYRPGKHDDNRAHSFGGKRTDDKKRGLPSDTSKSKRGVKQTGLKEKDLVGIPWMVAFALRADGWYLRQDIIWSKPNPMPESVKDRCTKSHEYIFLLSKSPKYYYDYEAIKEPAAYLQANSPESIKSPYGQGIKKYKGNANTFRGGAYCNGNKGNSELGRRTESGNNVTGNIPGRDDNGRACNKPDQILRNKRSVWTVSTKPFKGSHFATFPPDLIEPCILAGCPKDGIVLDPFFGAGTTGIVSLKNGRNYLGIELNPEYAELATNRIEYGTVESEEIEINKNQLRLF